MDNRQRYHPGRHRAADQMMNADLAVEQCQPPESEQRQAVGIDRFADDLGNEIIARADAQRGQPQPQHIMREPPVDRRAACAGGEKRQVGDDEQHRKPADRRQPVPARDIDVMHVARPRGGDQRNDEKHAGQRDQQIDLPWDLQPFLAIVPAMRQRAEREDQRDVPDHRADHRQLGIAQRGVEHARHHPRHDRDPGERRPAVDDEIEVHRAHPPEGQRRGCIEEIGPVQLQRGDHPEGRSQHQPHHRADQQHRHGPGRYRIDAGARRIEMMRHALV